MITLNDVRQVMNTADDRTLSLYLHVDAGYRENQAETPQWRIVLKNALRDIEDKIGDNDRDYWKSLRERVDAFFKTYEVQSKTLVLFATGDDVLTYELPVALSNQFDYGAPLLTPAVWAIDEYEPYLIAMVDQEEARFVHAYLGFSDQQDSMTIDLADYDFAQKLSMPSNRDGGVAVGGNAREQFEDMIDEHVRRFYRDVADHIQKLTDEYAIDRVVLSGAERSAHAVHDLLRPQVGDKIVGVLPIPMETPDHEIGKHIADVALNFERQHELDLVKDVIDRAKASGRGALGIDKIHNALNLGQVELVILPYPPKNDEVARDLTLKALENNAEIELVHGSPAILLKDEGGAAARLYYTVETA